MSPLNACSVVATPIIPFRNPFLSRFCFCSKWLMLYVISLWVVCILSIHVFMSRTIFWNFWLCCSRSWPAVAQMSPSSFTRFLLASVCIFIIRSSPLNLSSKTIPVGGTDLDARIVASYCFIPISMLFNMCFTSWLCPVRALGSASVIAIVIFSCIFAPLWFGLVTFWFLITSCIVHISICWSVPVSMFLGGGCVLGYVVWLAFALWRYNLTFFLLLVSLLSSSSTFSSSPVLFLLALISGVISSSFFWNSSLACLSITL